MMNRSAALAEAVRELDALIRKAQAILETYLQPDSGVDEKQTLKALIELFDGPEQRRVQAAARRALEQ